MRNTGTSSSASEQIQINVNGEECKTHARTLEALLASLDFSKIRVATAVNGEFVPAAGARISAAFFWRQASRSYPLDRAVRILPRPTAYHPS